MRHAPLLLALLAGLAPVPKPIAEWKTLAPGLELGSLQAKRPSPVGDSRITVLRIDPNEWRLELLGRSQTGDTGGKTAREWAQGHGLLAAINAGMFRRDYTTHLGYLEFRGRVLSPDVNGYSSVAAFDPREGAKGPPFQIFDLDQPGVTVPSIRESYASLVQNLRLVKKPGENRWNQQTKRWSEAALGEDREGRILFVFCRSPFSMHDLNRELLAAGLGLVALQHLEGGPEAQLYLNVGGTELERFGSYESFFHGNDANQAPWPIPNVLGIRRRTATGGRGGAGGG